MGPERDPGGIRPNGSGIIVGSERNRSGIGDGNGSGIAPEEVYNSGVRRNGMQRFRSGGSVRRIKSGGSGVEGED